MKKLALLLAALSVASVSYAKEVMPVAEVAAEPAVEETVKAAPVLTVKYVGQDIVVENTSSANGLNGEDIGEAVHLQNRVGLALGDTWTFDLMARKTWSASTDEWKDGKGDTHPDGMKSAGHRFDLAAVRHFENFGVGLHWRGEKDLDRLCIPVSYNFGMFNGYVMPGYKFTDSGNDQYYLESELGITYGPATLAYYFEGVKDTGDAEGHDYFHQVRLRGTVYSTERLTLGAEYRYQFLQDVETTEKNKTYDGRENNRHVAIVNAAYDLTENLVISGYYQYEFNKFDNHDAAKWDDNYYGEFGLGWTYNF